MTNKKEDKNMGLSTETKKYLQRAAEIIQSKDHLKHKAALLEVNYCIRKASYELNGVLGDVGGW